MPDMAKEVEVKVMTWGSRGFLQVEVIMDEGWNTPTPSSIQNSASLEEEEDIKESIIPGEESEECVILEEEVSMPANTYPSLSEDKHSTLPVLMGEPSPKNRSPPFYPNVEGHQQKGWEKMDSDEDQEKFPRNKLNIVGLGKLKNKIIQARRRERNRLWKERGRLKKVKMKNEKLKKTARINEMVNKTTQAEDMISKMAKKERMVFTPNTFKQLYLIGRSYVTELVRNIFT